MKLLLIGHILGTADLNAKMSDRCYLEKCLDRLYPKFVLDGLAARHDKQGNEIAILSLSHKVSDNQTEEKRSPMTFALLINKQLTIE